MRRLSKKSVFPLVAGLLFGAATTVAAPIGPGLLGGISVFSTDSSGAVVGDEWWASRSSNLSPTQPSNRLFVTNPNTGEDGGLQQLGLGTYLSPGTYQFFMYGDPIAGASGGTVGLNLFINSQTTAFTLPKISAYAPLNTSALGPHPAFVPNRSSDTRDWLGATGVSGSGTLTTITVDNFNNRLPIAVALTDFSWSSQSVFAKDRVGITGIGANGQNDYVGTFTLQVTALPPPVTKLVPGVIPDYHWNYGCTATSAGMLMGYWDRNGYGNLVGTPMADAPYDSAPQSLNRPHFSSSNYVTENQLVDDLIATKGHAQAFWKDATSSPYGYDVANDDPAPFTHSYDCLADWLGTSQGTVVNGGTDTRNIARGLRKWAALHGYGSSAVASSIVPTSFNNLIDEIDAKRPVLLDMYVDGIGEAGHTVLAYGYRDGGAGNQWFAVRDTWQDHNSNGKYAIEAEVDGSGVEWWRWSLKSESTAVRPVAYVFELDSLHLESGAASRENIASLSDGFDRTSGGELTQSLGYRVSDASPGKTGHATTVLSPLDASDSVLQLFSSTGDPLAVATDLDISPVTDIGFNYLFDDTGKIEVFIGGIKVATLLSPASGPGSPGSGDMGYYFQEIDLASFGIDPLITQEFQLVLSGIADPTIYVDNLSVVGTPEPSAAGLGLVALAWVFRRKRDRS
jgi:hypothetical protein